MVHVTHTNSHFYRTCHTYWFSLPPYMAHTPILNSSVHFTHTDSHYHHTCYTYLFSLPPYMSHKPILTSTVHVNTDQLIHCDSIRQRKSQWHIDSHMTDRTSYTTQTVAQWGIWTTCHLRSSPTANSWAILTDEKYHNVHFIKPILEKPMLCENNDIHNLKADLNYPTSFLFVE